MSDKTHADVDRALAAFGGTALKYRSFGSPALRPAARTITPPLAPLPDEPSYDPFAVPPPPPQPPASAPVHSVQPMPAPQPMAPPPPPVARASDSDAAAKLFPLLGAAMPEASDVHVGAYVPPTRPLPQQQREQHASAPAYDSPPVVSYTAPPSPIVTPPATAPHDSYAPATGQSDAPFSSSAPASPPAGAWRPPPIPERTYVPRADRPHVASVYQQPIARYPAAPAGSQREADEAASLTTLGAHLSRAAGGEANGPNGIPGGRGLGEPEIQADRRSIAEMFRLLSGPSDRGAATPAFARPQDGDAGLFRRI